MGAAILHSKKLPIQEIYRRQAEELKRKSREEWKLSLAKSREALARNVCDSDAYVDAAWSLRMLNEHDNAIALFKEGITKCTPSLRLYQWHIKLLEECNRTKEAIAAAHDAMLLFPDDILMKLKGALALPVLYDNDSEIDFYRHRFEASLQILQREISLDTPETRRRAMFAIGNHSNASLGYQGRNDRDLQMQYGELVHRIMSANFPQWAQPLHVPAVPIDGRLRIGYVSSRFRNLSATKYFLGWLREHSRERFVTYAYHVGRKTDSATEEVRRVSQYFRHLSNSIEDTCQAIRNDDLHLLVYLDIGMDPLTTQLAALRLAPIQCAAWDQPITSGLPTIDYFISSNLAEPEVAQDHYSEALIRLPGVGVCYQKPVIPTALLKKDRREFGLRGDAVVYLCCQYAFKYLPNQDHVLAEIAKEVRDAQFVFLTENDGIARDLRSRLKRNFSSVGLSAERHCVVLPAVDRFTYWNLNMAGDVFLDTIGWSGGVSTFEAVALSIPIVTLPGTLMRSRQSYAILTQLGVTETIAHNAQQYTNIAVRLGLDRRWRDKISEQMNNGHASLYSDRLCVKALEKYYAEVINARLLETEGRSGQ